MKLIIHAQGAADLKKQLLELYQAMSVVSGQWPHELNNVTEPVVAPVAPPVAAQPSYQVVLEKTLEQMIAETPVRRKPGRPPKVQSTPKSEAFAPYFPKTNAPTLENGQDKAPAPLEETEEIAPETPVQLVVSTTEPVIQTPVQEPKAAKSPEEILAEVKAALTEVQTSKGFKAAKDLVSKFGATRFAELKPADYPAVIEACSRVK